MRGHEAVSRVRLATGDPLEEDLSFHARNAGGEILPEPFAGSHASWQLILEDGPIGLQAIYPLFGAECLASSAKCAAESEEIVCERVWTGERRIVPAALID